ncbi:MAG: hypothetical protein J7647_07780 [Cyanobacteria bacterium SBLK]|nr:hypothetical protein [Cyanobacteria bacterium SBLK]
MKTQTIFKSIAGLAASAVLTLGFSQRASAFTLITDPGDPYLVTSIEDLNVAGTLYDVEFIFDSFDNIYGNVGNVEELEGSTPTFWNNTALGEIAALEVMGAMGDSFGTWRVDESLLLDSFMVIIGSRPSPFSGVVSSWYDGTPSLLIDGLDPGLHSTAHPMQLPYAVFSPASTPEPIGTVAILAGAGMGLFATRKGKNAKNE